VRCHVDLLCPADTVMDLNIGAALWLAAQAEGELHGSGERFRSAARVAMLGHGADELCGGYGRHRTAFRHQVRLCIPHTACVHHSGPEPHASSSCSPNPHAAAAGGSKL
jgi:asparagine synthetase B (glutamine-hydrolysing)